MFFHKGKASVIMECNSQFDENEHFNLMNNSHYLLYFNNLKAQKPAESLGFCMTYWGNIPKVT